MIKHSLHFFYDEVRTCCSNVSGPVIYFDYSGEKIDWNEVFKFRNGIVGIINNDDLSEDVTYSQIGCKDCFEFEKYAQFEKISPFENKINRIYFQNNMSCNAKCSYCTFQNVERGYRYKLLPIVNSLIENDLLSENPYIFMSGGEMTIYPEFEELLTIFSNYKKSFIELVTSGIKFSSAIQNAFVQNKLTMLLSLDSGTRETYQKIKKVDCFDDVVNNLKIYTDATDNAKNNIILKFILVDCVNDNIQEINKFFDVVLSLGVKNVRLDVDFEKYHIATNHPVPKHYHQLFDYFNSFAQKNNLSVKSYGQTEEILNYE